jgi:predicted kinase
MEAIILIGIQGAGKTTFYRERFFDSHLRISLDMLRTRERERLLVATCVTSQQRFVVDNTNVTRAERAVYLTAARAGHFRSIGYFFRAGLRDALRRNAQRRGRSAIPVAGVAATAKRLEPPHPDEGFDELYQVEVDDRGGFVVTPWTPPERTKDEGRINTGELREAG